MTLPCYVLDKDQKGYWREVASEIGLRVVDVRASTVEEQMFSGVDEKLVRIEHNSEWVNVLVSKKNQSADTFLTVFSFEKGSSPYIANQLFHILKMRKCLADPES